MPGDKKIDELDVAATLTGVEPIATVQSGVTVQTTAQDIANLAGSGASLPISETNGTTTVLADLYTTNFDIYVNDEFAHFSELTFQPNNSYGIYLGTNRGIHLDASSNFILGDSGDVLFEHTGGGSNTFQATFSNVLLGNANNLNISLTSTTFNGPIDMQEISTPASPPANTGRTFMRDNGSGKTQYCVLFPSGAVQVLSTEP